MQITSPRFLSASANAAFAATAVVALFSAIVLIVNAPASGAKLAAGIPRIAAIPVPQDARFPATGGRNSVDVVVQPRDDAGAAPRTYHVSWHGERRRPDRDGRAPITIRIETSDHRIVEKTFHFGSRRRWRDDTSYP